MLTCRSHNRSDTSIEAHDLAYRHAGALMMKKNACFHAEAYAAGELNLLMSTTTNT